jgi:site-specific DNA-methyltransferase (adenine-specific)
MDGNTLFYGNNLDILREHIKDESVDLIYLDPPFNSQANYNILFHSPAGEQSPAQIEAFEDTWHWTDEAEKAFDEVMTGSNTDTAEMLRAMRSFLKENDMMAYLTMMAVRLVELHRVLKPTGSLYLHCDPTASAYLRIVMDKIFGVNQFRNEIHWYYYNKIHDSRKKQFPAASDTIMFYVKDIDSNFVFHQLKEQRETPVRQLKRVKRAGKMVNARDESGKLMYQIKEDRTLDNVWRIPCLQHASPEKLPYPTQKPQVLLERIIEASSNEGDIILDPFCGCGTTIHAAQKLQRRWIGIDITHLAISLIEKRLNDAFPGITYEVHGTPKDVGGAKALADADKYQFQWWAVSLVNAIPYGGKKKGADTGIDGHIYFKPDGKTTEKVIVSVKGGENVGVAMVRDLAHVVDREKAKIGIFITLAEPTKPMQTEAIKVGFYDSPFSGKFPKIQILTIEELFADKKPQIPLIDTASFKKAQQENTTKQGKLF